MHTQGGLAWMCGLMDDMWCAARRRRNRGAIAARARATRRAIL